MAIYHNGIKLSNLYHDGNKIKSLYHNGELIYQDGLPTGTLLYTGDPFIITGGNPLIQGYGYLFRSGEQSSKNNEYWRQTYNCNVITNSNYINLSIPGKLRNGIKVTFKPDLADESFTNEVDNGDRTSAWYSIPNNAYYTSNGSGNSIAPYLLLPNNSGKQSINLYPKTPDGTGKATITISLNSNNQLSFSSSVTDNGVSGTASYYNYGGYNTGGAFIYVADYYYGVVDSITAY